MPGFDQTGPGGQGSMTGRRMGRCTNYGANLKNTEETPTMNPGDNSPENLPGRGFGFGWRRGGRGLGRRGRNRFRGGY